MERKPCASVRFGSLALLLLIPLGCGESVPSSVNTGQGGHNGGGGAGAGGASGSGGSAAGGSSGGSSGSGGRSSAGGDGGTSAGGAPGSGGNAGGAGGKGNGGAAGAGSGGTAGRGGSAGSGGGAGSGGKTAGGGTTGSGGGSGNAGAGGRGGVVGASGAGGGGAGGGGSVSTDCTITISSGAVSSKMATVGVVEWSTDLSSVASAQIVYTLNNAGASILNKGGTAPVDLKKANYRTLLLGLKPSSTYTYHVEATTASGSVCKSADKTLTTGTLSGVPTITRTATNPGAQAGGFIVTSSGQGGGGGFGGGGGGGSSGAFIIDADGTVVWYAAGPSQCSRAHMDYEGVNMWMLALNVQNSGGEMRFVSMDGATSKTAISGLSGAHHDFTVLPGKIAAMVWASSGMDPESNLVEMASDGTGSATTVFKIGSNLYAGGASAFGGGSGNTYHCNYIVYHPADNSFTISDRNPNLFVKVKHDGTPVWQIGGSCTNAKAPKCASGTWQVNHGHDFDGNGNMLVFNNGQSGSTHILDLKLNETASAISYTTNKDFTSSNNSNTMGDVQYLPNGNRLITYSAAGVILEVDASWATVQSLKGASGYAGWRQTLYGPPTRK